MQRKCNTIFKMAKKINCWSCCATECKSVVIFTLYKCYITDKTTTTLQTSSIEKTDSKTTSSVVRKEPVLASKYVIKLSFYFWL